MQRIIIVCAGGHGRVVADILTCLATSGAKLSTAGFVDDTPALIGTRVAGLPVLGPLDSLPKHSCDAIVVALGDNAVRRRLCDRFVAAGAQLVPVVHPRAVVAKTANVGAGAVVCAGAIVQPGASIGRGAIVNTSASVDHDSRIGDFAHVAPGARIGAHVTVGDETLIALAASVVAGRTIGARSIVGAGSLVLNDLRDDVVAFGTPARVRGEARNGGIAPPGTASGVSGGVLPDD